MDASYHNDEGVGSTGAILRDLYGNFLGGSCSFFPNASSASMMEAQAMKEGLKLAVSLGYNRVVAESDCLEVVEACGGGNTWWHEGAAIFADCVDLVVEIGSVQFTHCLREANGVAHEIAKYSYENHLSCNWIDDFPSFIHESLVNDVSVLS